MIGYCWFHRVTYTAIDEHDRHHRCDLAEQRAPEPEPRRRTTCDHLRLVLGRPS